MFTYYSYGVTGVHRAGFATQPWVARSYSSLGVHRNLQESQPKFHSHAYCFASIIFLISMTYLCQFCLLI